MEAINHLRVWVGKNLVALAFAGFSVLLGLAFLLPPYESYFVLERFLLGVAYLVLGVLNFLVPPILSLPLAIGIILFALLGLLVGFLVQFLWARRWGG